MAFRIIFLCFLCTFAINVFSIVVDYGNVYISFAYFLDVISTLNFDFTQILSVYNDLKIIIDGLKTLVIGNLSIDNIWTILSTILNLPFKIVYAILSTGLNIVTSLLNLISKLVFIPQ